MKLFEFIAGILLIWFVLRAVRQGSQPARTAGKTRRPAPPQRSAIVSEATDTVRCARCGTYVPAQGASACERADCPLAKHS